MKVVQEENLSQVDHHMESRYQIEPMSCFIFYVRYADLCIRVTYFYFLIHSIQKNPAFARFFYAFRINALRFAKSSIKLTSA